MGLLSVCNGYIKDKYRGGSKTVSISKVRAKGNDYTAQHMFAPGLEINPADGENLIITKIDGSSSYLVTIAGTNQEVEPDTARGERRLFSVATDGKTIKAIAKFKNDGTLELNGATDSAVLFSTLNAQLQAFVAAVNTAFAAKLDGGGSSPALSLDLSTAESADVKLS